MWPDLLHSDAWAALFGGQGEFTKREQARLDTLAELATTDPVQIAQLQGEIHGFRAVRKFVETMAEQRTDMDRRPPIARPMGVRPPAARRFRPPAVPRDDPGYRPGI